MPITGYIPVSPSLLPKNDPRFIKWKESLKKRPPSWSKGKTKYTDPSVKKISDTFKKKKIDNFSEWRHKARELGIIPKEYSPFKKDENLACLIGLALGDGHICKFARTESLAITLGTDKPGLIKLTAFLVEKVIGKKPNIEKKKGINAVRVVLYQKYIAKRLGIPCGNRGKIRINVPYWIRKSREFSLAFLRGLYEAEASLSIHLPTYTYNFSFSNTNPYLLKIVENYLRSLNLHPEVRLKNVRLRRKEEVKYFKDLINFRNYNAGWCNGCTSPSGGEDSRFES